MCRTTRLGRLRQVRNRIDECCHRNATGADLFDSCSSLGGNGQADLHRLEIVGSTRCAVVALSCLVKQPALVEWIPKGKPRIPRNIAGNEGEVGIETHRMSIADVTNTCSLMGVRQGRSSLRLAKISQTKDTSLGIRPGFRADRSQIVRRSLDRNLASLQHIGTVGDLQRLAGTLLDQEHTILFAVSKKTCSAGLSGF